MPRPDDPRLHPASVRTRYNDQQHYLPIDPWHQRTAAEVRRCLARFWAGAADLSGGIVLNAGSGATTLGVSAELIVSVDLSEATLTQQPNAVVGSVEALPLRSHSVQTIVCVGSVINYCDAAVTIQELARVLRPSGRLLLEFESSGSAELLRSSSHGAPAAVFESFYGSRVEVVWGYSLAYISNLLRAVDFSIDRITPLHVLSPWILLATRRPALAAAFARLDGVARSVPGFSRWASNYFLVCTKGQLSG